MPTASSTQLPWVGHRSRKWEPEPLRWIGVNAGRASAAAKADAVEHRGGRRSRFWGGIVKLLARMALQAESGTRPGRSSGMDPRREELVEVDARCTPPSSPGSRRWWPPESRWSATHRAGTGEERLVADREPQGVQHHRPTVVGDVAEQLVGPADGPAVRVETEQRAPSPRPRPSRVRRARATATGQ